MSAPPAEEAGIDAKRYPDEATYRSTRAPVELASTLLPEAYREDDFFAVEQERLFARSWVAVGLAAKVRGTGDVITAEVAGQPVVVTRDRSGALRAFYNVCRHRGAQLVEADCHLARFRCPYHSWAYALDGTCIGTPLFEGSDIPDDQRPLFDVDGARNFDRADYGLLPVAVAQWAHLLFVNLDPAAAPLEQWLGDLPQRLAGYRLGEQEPVREASYEIAANWKLVAENFMEYYHLPWVHPELVKVSRVEDHHRFQGHGMYTGMCTSPISTDDASGWTALRPVPGLSADDAVSGRFVWVFPNVAVAVVPNHVFTIVVTPTGARSCTENVSVAVHPSSLDAVGAASTLDRMAAFWDEVNREDIAIVERVQRGLAARAYPGGRMCYRFEEPLHRFQNMVIDRMVGVERVPPGDEHEGLALAGSRVRVTT